jgi:hypothetical protein
MADALSLGVTYSSVQGRAYPLPLGARARPHHIWPRFSGSSSCSAAFALPHPDKPYSYQGDQGRGIPRGIPALIMPLAVLFLPHF